MRDRYSAARGYRDSGVLRSANLSADRKEPSRSVLMFRTAFDRSSNGFYFEYLELQDRFQPPAHAVVWRHATTTAQRWWTTKPDEVEQLELPLALAAFAGVSSKTSWLVPSLLLELSPTFVLPYRVVGTTTIDAVPAFHLEWRKEQDVVGLWLRKSDYAVIRFAEHRAFPGGRKRELPEAVRQQWSPAELERFRDRLKVPFTSDHVIDFYPVFDEPMDASAFQFSPPVPNPPR